MNNFQVGDRVRFIYNRPTDPWYGNEGYIRAIEHNSYFVIFDDGTYMSSTGWGPAGYPARFDMLEFLTYTSNIPEPNDDDLI